MGTRVIDIQSMTEAGVDLVFNRAAKMPRKTYYSSIVTELSQVKKTGNYHTIGNIGRAEEKDEGDIINFDRIKENYETNITSTTKSKGVEATLEALEYDLERVVEATFGTPLLRVMQTYKERECADLYNDAFATTGADGVYQIDDDHPLQNSALVNDNLATGALTPDNLIAAKNKFNFIYDQAGDYFDTEPTHLLIHKNKLFVALQILESQLMAMELSNTKNVVEDVMPIKVVVNPYIDYATATDVSPWFLLDRTLTDAGAILQKKRGTWLKTWWVNENQVYRGAALEMYGVGIISPGYGIVGSTGA
ncbi:MAG: hypothetical protein WC194_12060 [Mesotoga sp.]|uniref:hypothetical protein n=1 Tax=Mesotoga sp. TaxID=2053577 RepID=UPI00356B030F